MKFKNYEREYERVFSGNKKIKGRTIDDKCDLNEVSTVDDRPDGVDNYINLLEETLGSFQTQYFDYLVKVTWLLKRFKYKGERRQDGVGNGIQLDQAFGIFLRRDVGYDKRLFTSSLSLCSRIATYFYDFFPNFDDGDPFKEDYKYPFEHVKLEYLVLVYQMDERMDLLKYAEEKRIVYTEFLDYIINYINCYNDEHGDKYKFIFLQSSVPYVKKYEEFKTSDFHSR